MVCSGLVVAGLEMNGSWLTGISSSTDGCSVSGVVDGVQEPSLEDCSEGTPSLCGSPVSVSKR